MRKRLSLKHRILIAVLVVGGAAAASIAAQNLSLRLNAPVTLPADM